MTTAHPLFHHFLILARGTVSRRGRSVTVIGTLAWTSKKSPTPTGPTAPQPSEPS
ncbi:hypothetical protein [Kitasatospora sp. NPDC088346]|uniref:hypothetical protein n=1 Tax=Kitasatospora sp. NPDC088346 TaxID=3364073 RepID=UPI0038055BFD